MASSCDPFQLYDFDNAYFDSNSEDMDFSGCDADMDISVDTDLDYDIEEEKFWFVFPLVGEMVAYSSGITTSA